MATEETYSDEVEELLALSKDIHERAEKLKARLGVAGTAPQWFAVNDLQDASRYVHSAAAHLHRHDERFEKKAST